MIKIIISNYNSHILTKEKGTVLLRDLQIGDLVYCEDCQWRPVTDITVTPYFGEIYHLYINRRLHVCVDENQQFLYIPLDLLSRFREFPKTEFFNKYIERYIVTFRFHGRKYPLACNTIKNIKSKDFLCTAVNFNAEPCPDDLNINLKWENIDYNQVIIPEYRILGRVNVDKYRMPEAQFRQLVRDIRITTNLLILLGIVCKHGEFTKQYKKSYRGKLRVKYRFDLYLHTLYRSIFSNIIYTVYDSFHHLLNSNRIFMAQHFHMLNPHVVNILQHWSNRIPDWVNAVHPKLQLYFFKGLFLESEYEKTLSFSTDNIPLFYDLVTILNKNYINPTITNHYDTLTLTIIPPQLDMFKKFLFKNENYKVHRSMLNGTNMPIPFNGHQYLKHSVIIKKSTANTEPLLGVNIKVQDDHFFTLNHVLTKC